MAWNEWPSLAWTGWPVCRGLGAHIPWNTHTEYVSSIISSCLQRIIIAAIETFQRGFTVIKVSKYGDEISAAKVSLGIRNAAAKKVGLSL